MAALVGRAGRAGDAAGMRVHMYACDGQAPAAQAKGSVGVARATERHARTGDLGNAAA